jgi:ATP-dependent Clp protease ATP-binding subunit ClpX
VVATLHELDESALIQILTEPKNSIVKQYTHLLSYEDVNLQVTKEALVAIAQAVINRETGARGLRAVMENIMLDTMYEIPSLEGVRECVITADSVLEGELPLLVYEDEREALSA